MISEFCKDCLLQCRPVKSRYANKGRFLVIAKTPTYNQVRGGDNIAPAAMKVFANNMRRCGFTKKDFVFTNSILCNYDNTRHNSRDNKIIQKACRGNLLELVDQVQPEVIIPLGAEAAASIYGRGIKITKARGVPDRIEGVDAIILPMMDPALVHIYPQHSPLFASDCNTLQRIVKYDYDLGAAEKSVFGDYRQIYDLQFLINRKPEVLSFDVETKGARWQEEDNHLLTMQFSTQQGEGFLLSWRHPDDPYPIRGRDKIKKQLKELLTNPSTKVIGQNCKFDMMWVWRTFGFRAQIGGDTLMLAATLDENLQNKNLDTLTKIYAKELAGYADVFNSKYDKARMDLVPLKDIINYGVCDADAVFRVHKRLRGELEEDSRLTNYYDTVAMPGINAFMAMERPGMLVDEKALDEFEVEVEEYVEGLRKSILAQVPRPVKRDRTRAHKDLQLSKAEFIIQILFEHRHGFGLTPQVFTKKTENLEGKFKIPSTSSKDHLPYFFEKCPITIEIAEWMKANRLLGTSIRRFRENYICKGKIYPTYNLHTAVTGRTSSKDPNCFPGDVEVLTVNGWERFDTVSKNTKVAQYELLNGEIDFVAPTNYIKKYTRQSLVHIKTDFFIDIVCTKNHRFPTMDRRRGTIKSHIAEEYPKDRLQIQAGFYKGGTKWLRHSQVVLICALQADAHVTKSGQITWVFSKERKRDRLVEALDKEYIDYGYSITSKGDYRIYIGRSRTPNWLVGKKIFGKWIMQCSQEVLQDISKEVFYWDGDYTREQIYTSTIRQNVDWVQIALILTGSRAWCREASNDKCKLFNVLNVTQDLGYSYTANRRIDTVPYKGYVYCFSTPKDTLIVRYNGRVHVVHNSQNFISRGKFAKPYKRIFKAPDGYAIIGADLSQIELRLVANMSNDPVMIKIYQNGGDIHRHTAIKTMGITDAQFDAMGREDKKLKRFKAKAINFGFIYKMWWRRFKVYAKTDYGLEFTDKEAKETRERFFKTYPALERWHGAMECFAQDRGFVRSYSGRIRHLPMIYSEDEKVRQEAGRQSINAPVQNFGSDLGVLSMSRIDQEIDPNYMQLNGFVHDAVYVLVPLEYVEWGAKTLKHYMESNDIKALFDIDMKIPIVADVGFGINAGDVFEMDGLDFDKPFDFNELRENERESIDLPEQKIPPNNGRL